MTDKGPGSIRELNDATIDRIAAGEVVERPASAVKELVENAVDADANRVTVRVEDGGKAGIRVRDDGVGMTEEEVRLAVRKHTTSKIRDIDDLESGLGTLGFRGEALHAIGAVSRLTVRTRPRGGEHGTELIVEGGDIDSVNPVGCPEGTTAEVEDLFYNVPARRKYLKTDITEFGHVQEVVAGYALANPGVAVTLEHGDRETFATPGDGDLRSVVLAVYGREVAANMVEILADHDPGGPLDSVRGLVSHPETNRADRKYVNAFVNGRYVRATTIREAVIEAYGSQLASDRFPFAVLDCAVPPRTVDVNVHPRKMEVRHAEPEGVKRQVRMAVENALRDEGILRSSAPRGRSAPEETKVEPSSTPDDAGTDSPQSTSSSPRGSTSEDTKRRSQSSEATASETSPSDSTPRPQPSRSTSASGGKTQTTLDGDDAHPTTRYDTFPDLRVLGQFHDTYIVAESDDGLLLIDQHAADERINYERLKDRFEGNTTTQTLANPVELELTSGEAALFDSYQEALARLGFYANRVDDRTIEVTTVPGLVAESAGATLIRDVLGDLLSGEAVAEDTVDAVADDLLSDMACYPSITGNTSLTEGSVVDLLSALDECENPWACPHGRPVLIHIDSDEIDDRFERDYPGH